MGKGAEHKNKNKMIIIDSKVHNSRLFSLLGHWWNRATDKGRVTDLHAYVRVKNKLFLRSKVGKSTTKTLKRWANKM